LSGRISDRFLVTTDPHEDLSTPGARATVAAFIGASPRGPVDTPVAVSNLADFRRRFGAMSCSGALEQAVCGFFDHGGDAAVIVRTGPRAPRAVLRLPCNDDDLLLEAVNPGEQEFLRASVDYDRDPSTGNDRFNLVVQRIDSPRSRLVEEQESYANLSADPADADFIGHALSGSRLVRIAGDVPRERPRASIRFTGGGDIEYYCSGAVPAMADMLVDPGLPGDRRAGTGLYALDALPSVDLLVPVPGFELSPLAVFTAEQYCRERQALLLIDTPAQWTDTRQVAAAQGLPAWSSPNIATFFPRPAAGPGLVGALAGRLVAGDRQRGIWHSPPTTGIRLREPSPPQTELTDLEAVRLVRLGVNPVRRAGPGLLELTGLVTTAKAAGLPVELTDLRLRRTSLYVIGSLVRLTRWAVFHENRPGVRRRLRAQIGDYLRALHNVGALAGNRDTDAYILKCDSDTNRRHAGHTGRVEFIVGFALARPHEFMAWRIFHDRADCRVTELGWGREFALAS